MEATFVVEGSLGAIGEEMSPVTTGEEDGRRQIQGETGEPTCWGKKEPDLEDFRSGMKHSKLLFLIQCRVGRRVLGAALVNPTMTNVSPDRTV